MKELALPDYTALSEALDKTTLKLHPAQFHGLICGILCADPAHPETWEKFIADQKKNNQLDKALHQLYEMSAKQLEEFLFEFQLLLPSDDEPLPMRAEALTLWCQGFLTGLELAKIPIDNREPGEVTEAINDLIEIAKMNYEDVVASEEDEEAYIELVEYVRMAIILIYQDLREVKQGEQAASSPHVH